MKDRNQQKMNHQEMQSELINIFIEKFKTYEGGLNLSTPLIPRITKRYLKNRVLIVGQETNTWYNKTKDDLKEDFQMNLDKVEELCIRNRYENFIANFALNYGGKFWTFKRMLYEQNIINGEMIENGELGHCWMNFFSVEACQHKRDEMGRPTKNRKLATEIMEIQNDLLLESIKILNPRLIILLIGNSLDWLLINKALKIQNCRFIPVDDGGILEPKQLAEIEVLDTKNILSNMKIYRGYHPTYFMGRINRFKGLNQRRINKGIESSNANYYTDLFVKILKNNTGYNKA